MMDETNSSAASTTVSTSPRQRRKKKTKSGGGGGQQDPEGYVVRDNEVEAGGRENSKKGREEETSNVVAIEETELFTDTYSFFMTARYPCERICGSHRTGNSNNNINGINDNTLDLSEERKEMATTAEKNFVDGNAEDCNNDNDDGVTMDDGMMMGTTKINKNQQKLYQVDSDKFCLPFWMGWFIVGLQLFIYIVVILSTTTQSGQPPNADILMRLAQAFALIVAMYTQSDLVDAVFMLTEGSQQLQNNHDDVNDKITTPFKFALSNVMRFVAGNLGIVSSFVLVIYAPEVVDLLLNFTAIEFVATLDDSAFQLASKGFFGINLKKKAKQIEDYRYDFHLRKKAVRFRFLVYFLYVLLYAGAFVAVAVLQSKRQIGVENEVYVQFDDTYVSDLFGISGAYIGCRGFSTKRNSKTYTKSIGYVDASYHDNCPELSLLDGNKNDDDENNEVFPANSFFFCTDTGKGEEGWVFIKKSTKEPCSKSNYIVRSLLDSSESTPSDSYDILSHANAKWLVQKPETGGEAFLDSIFIESVQSFGITYNCTYGLQFVGSLVDEWGATVRTISFPLPKSDYPSFKGRFGPKASQDGSSFFEEFSLVYRQAFLGVSDPYNRQMLFPDTVPECDNDIDVSADDNMWSLTMYDGLRWHYMDPFDPQMFVDFVRKRFNDVNEDESKEDSPCVFKTFLKYYLRDKSWMFNETIAVPRMISDPMKFLAPDDTVAPTKDLKWYEAELSYSRGIIQPGRVADGNARVTPDDRIVFTGIELSCVDRTTTCNSNEFPLKLDITTGRFPKETSVLLQHNPPFQNYSLSDFGYNQLEYFTAYFTTLGGLQAQFPNSKRVAVAEHYQAFSISEGESKDFRFRDGETRYVLETCVPFQENSNFCMELAVLNTEPTKNDKLVEFDIGFGEFYLRDRDSLMDCKNFILCYMEVLPSLIPEGVEDGYQTQFINDQTALGFGCSFEDIVTQYPGIKNEVQF